MRESGDQGDGGSELVLGAGSTEQSWCRVGRKAVPATQVHSARVDMSLTQDGRESQ